MASIGTLLACNEGLDEALVAIKVACVIVSMRLHDLTLSDHLPQDAMVQLVKFSMHMIQVLLPIR